MTNIVFGCADCPGTFWFEMKYVLQVTQPLVLVLRKVDRERPFLAYVYEAMSRAKEGICSYLTESGLLDRFANISTRIYERNMSRMQLQGCIPEALFLLHKLEQLWLDNNHLCGEVPSVLKTQADLKSLRLNGNLLRGTLPHYLRRIPNLSYDADLICNSPDDAACRDPFVKQMSSRSCSCDSDLSSFSSSRRASPKGVESDSQPSVRKHVVAYSETSQWFLIDERISTNDSIVDPQKYHEEMWPCLCDPGGLLGTQQYIKSTNSFTNCNCKSTCPLCDAGEVLNLLDLYGSHCSCTVPMLIVVKFLNVQLGNYSLDLEKNFTKNFAGTLHLSPLQVVPVARHGESITLYLYIFPLKGSNDYQAELNYIETTLIQRNGSSDDFLWDPELGGFLIVKIENPLHSKYRYGWKHSGRASATKLFIAAVILAPVSALVVIISILCIAWNKFGMRRNIPVFSIEKDPNGGGFTDLISHGSSFTEDFRNFSAPYFGSYKGIMATTFRRFTSKREIVAGITASRFSYLELAQATQKFSKGNHIGMGGSSNVYRGHLKDGRVVAVKKLNSRHGYDADREFCTEIELLSRLHHFHLVPFIGYCFEFNGKHVSRLLVYEYMPNGNLRDQLDGVLGKEPLTWLTRICIALGAARGLEYLHVCAAPRVLHCDFKSSNVLLDDKWRAKVADFGMAKTLTNNDEAYQLKSPMKMLGTFGYFAPEYAMMGKPSMKSDVFSFGVVLLELITGRRALDDSLPKEEQSLVMWASLFLNDPNEILSKMVDPCLTNDFPKKDMIIMAQLARACLQMDPELRPTMTEVVQVLSSLIPISSRRIATSQVQWTEPHIMLPEMLQFSDYNFSREEDGISRSSKSSKLDGTGNHVNDSTYETDCHKATSQISKASTALQSGLMETLIAQTETKGALSKGSLLLSASAHMECFIPSTASYSTYKSTEEPLDLTAPQMEKF